MASPAYPDSDDGVGSEFEGSDDGTQTDITVSDSDQEYLPENDPDASSSEESDDSDMAAEAAAAPPQLPAAIAAPDFVILGDPFADRRPSALPEVDDDFPDVHPEIISHHEEHPMSAMECFQLFIPKDVVSSLCLWTNVRAAKFFREHPNINPNKFMGKKWRDVKEDEMYVFLTLQLLMGVTKLPRISDYWSTSILCQGPPVFNSAIMSRNRFSQIQRFIRYSHPDDADRKNPLTRIATFFSMLQENTTHYFSAGESFAVDESLILFKGRLHFRQYIKTKRKRFGLKLFALCPSSEKARGYTWNFCLYTPRVYDTMLDNPELASLSKSERVPIFLMLDLLRKGRHVVLDNWYSSLRLAEFLLMRNTLTTGTIRPNRGVPKLVQDEPLQKGQTLFARKQDILVVKFRDTKNVHVISTKYEAGFVDHSRHVKGGKQEFLKKPSPIQRYNEQMGSVDLVDQLLEPTDPTRKSYAWFKKLGLHMICRMMLNARTVYLNLHPNTTCVEYVDFIKLVAHELLSEYSLGYAALHEVKTQKRPLGKGSMGASRKKARQEEMHGLLPIPSTDTRKRPQKRCRVCHREGKVKWSRKYCPSCPGEPGLCSEEHFQAWHTH